MKSQKNFFASFIGSVDAWPVWNKMLCMICYMLRCKHLDDRYDWFFFLISFHYWAAFVIYQQTAAHGLRCKNAQLHKICHTYPKIMKLGAVIPYLMKIRKINKSRDTAIKFYWHQYFFHQKSATFVISRNTDIDCILIHNF